MADRIVKENQSPLGQAALHWLSRAVKAHELQPHHFYPLSLAAWGLEVAEGDRAVAPAGNFEKTRRVFYGAGIE